ncbi:hypothetical protein PC116_g13089 [Phytophthora cactorum]|uniref:Uncharacterized protein n=1 Tax=Phytophthora cactorum TaxID=29920 RepID=A0A8T0YJN0_9STRA|nr:hypothetical protein PC112_g14200 [Phytophthora cactorum]KAG2817079.1 hypothetical protein PC111_g12856 [Phytophthora cactorum]KAG2852918.1 hypothetical protein PC113_g14609 [Phytophthora cactorum]KAG2908604.1 hypothetical protein PC114_g10427 [Phytophthora cactorum]KAG2925721.1 hypothetical protein PC117_g15117 [Phytophthora cactorum]
MQEDGWCPRRRRTQALSGKVDPASCQSNAETAGNVCPRIISNVLVDKWHLACKRPSKREDKHLRKSLLLRPYNSFELEAPGSCGQ